ncbi:Replication factor C subunit [Nesidiocoris tenuis]|uniref:Replication factor C subunit n=1 Tax=Nesidiocoris tenuis TaxID=355587 RepID=A0ABN7ANC4_9HEMI|nr:Replication factor C subunit [Nesidiocoris tenuis]
MSLWVDKHRPTSLQKLDFHLTQAQHLKNLVNQGDFPHLLFYGPSGAGKKTRIMALLKELYGPGVERLRMEQMTFTTPSNKKVDVMTVASNYHIEINPSDAGIHDRIVVMELIKNSAQTHQLDTSGQREFKVILLTEVDRLSKDAQHALRRTMEKYVATCRIILCANSVSQVIPAIKSRCLSIRVPAPSLQQVVAVLQNVCKKEGLTLPAELAERIAQKSDRNLRRAILMCEACKAQQYPFTPGQTVTEPDWQVYLRETAKIILSEQTPKKLMDVRGRLYELLIHGIPTDVIFKSLITELGKSVDMELKVRIAEMAAKFEHQMHNGSKVIFHLEAFIANFMSLYLHYIEDGVNAMF